jgi:PAS domain S-box-containing protein
MSLFPDSPVLGSTRGAADRDDLQVGDSLLHTLIVASPLAIYILDLSEKILLWNPAAEHIFGWSADEVLGEVNPTVPPDRWEESRAFREVILGGASFTERELRRLRKDGTEIDVRVSAARLCDADGVPQGLMVIAADITDWRRAERERAELLERERAARAQAEAAERRATLLAEGSALLDSSLDYRSTLRNLARLLVPALADYCLIDELEGELVCRVAAAHADPEKERLLRKDERHPLAGDPARHPVVRVLRGGGSVLVERVTDEVLGTIAHDEEHRLGLERIGLHSFMVVPLVARGRTLGAITLAFAASRRRFGSVDLDTAEELARRAALAVDTGRLYQQARQAVRARERMLAVVSHDLRNSLSTVLLNASAILDSGGSGTLGEMEREQLEWVSRSAEQMSRLISDLLDVSSIEAGRLSVELRARSVAPLVREATEMCRPLAGEKGISLTAEVADGTPPILADQGRLHQVLGNLLGNAIKFTPRDGSIRLRAAPGGAGEVLFAVSDSGPGVPEEHRDAVFELYWQGSRKGQTGAGLGLAIAKAIVEAHGGRIWTESRAEAGSTFYFTVPAAVGS